MSAKTKPAKASITTSTDPHWDKSTVQKAVEQPWSWNTSSRWRHPFTKSLTSHIGMPNPLCICHLHHRTPPGRLNVKSLSAFTDGTAVVVVVGCFLAEIVRIVSGWNGWTRETDLEPYVILLSAHFVMKLSTRNTIRKETLRSGNMDCGQCILNDIIMKYIYIIGINIYQRTIVNDDFEREERYIEVDIDNVYQWVVRLSVPVRIWSASH